MTRSTNKPIRVETTRAHREPGKTDSLTMCKFIDWNDSSDRKWLMNHLHWGMNNSQIVTLEPLDPRELLS